MKEIDFLDPSSVVKNTTFRMKKLDNGHVLIGLASLEKVKFQTKNNYSCLVDVKKITEYVERILINLFLEIGKGPYDHSSHKTSVADCADVAQS